MFLKFIVCFLVVKELKAARKYFVPELFITSLTSKDIVTTHYR